MEAYQFEPGSGSLEQQADGTWVAKALLATYPGQTFHYRNEGINSENRLVWDVDVAGDETGDLAYREVETPAYTRAAEDAVELVAKKDGKRKGSLTVYYT